MNYEEIYKEFKNNLEDDYTKFINHLAGLSGTQQNLNIRKKLLSFDNSLISKDINEIKFFIFNDIKVVLDLEKYYSGGLQ